MRTAHNTAKEALEQATIKITTEGYDTDKLIAKKQMERNITNVWQSKWNEETTGRELYEACKMEGRNRLKLTFKGTQLMTGHGNMEFYLRRFKLKDTDGNSECNLKESEVPEHYAKMQFNKKTARQRYYNWKVWELESKAKGASRFVRERSRESQ